MIRKLIATVGVVAMVPTAALAQDPDSRIADHLRRQLRAGGEVTLTLADGSTVTGRFWSVDSASLVVDPANGQRVRAPLGYISRARRRNGIKLGALIGAAAGVPPAVAVMSWFGNEGGPAVGAAALIVAGSIGAGIGIDALLSRNRTIYRRGDVAPRISPLITPDRTGVGVTLRWVF
jgi:hypothetical protein